MPLELIQIAACLIEVQTAQPSQHTACCIQISWLLAKCCGSVAAGISPSVVEHAVHWALSELRLQGDASAARQQHMLGQTIKAAKVNSRQHALRYQSVNRCSHILLALLQPLIRHVPCCCCRSGWLALHKPVAVHAGWQGAWGRCQLVTYARGVNVSQVGWKTQQVVIQMAADGCAVPVVSPMCLHPQRSSQVSSSDG